VSRSSLVIDETSPLDPEGGLQRKYYTAGTGLVRIGAVGDPEGETLVLVAVNHFNAKQMASVRIAVRRLEGRAYRISSIYRHTAPARRGN